MMNDKLTNALGQLDEAILAEHFAYEKELARKRGMRKKTLKTVLACAACFALLFGCFAAYRSFLPEEKKEIAATIMLDVNPSIEIEVDKKEKVLTVKALNEDAARVIEDRDFRSQKAEDVVLELVISMMEKGYIEKAKSAILLSVDGMDIAKADVLRLKLAELIDNMLPETNVVSQNIINKMEAERKEMVALSHEYGITHGKCTIIQKIVKAHPKFAFADLAELPISDLCVLLKDEENIDVAGEREGVISLKCAIEIAKNIFGLTDLNNVNKYVTEIHAYGGDLVYSVVLHDVDPKEGVDWVHRTELDPVTGEVLFSHTTKLYETEMRMATVADYAIDAYDAIRIACEALGVAVDDGYGITAEYSEAGKRSMMEPPTPECTDYDKWLVQVITETEDGDVYVYVDAETGEVKDINYWW